MEAHPCLMRFLTNLARLCASKSANGPRKNSFRPDSPSTTNFPRGRKIQSVPSPHRTWSVPDASSKPRLNHQKKMCIRDSRIVELDKGKLYSYQAGYGGYLELKEERMAMEQASERKRRSILRTELEWIRRGARARSTKQKGRIQRFEELLSLIHI